MVFDDKDDDKELLKRYYDVFNKMMDYPNIKFRSDDNFPLNKPLRFHNVTVTIRCVFSEDNKL